MRKTLLFVALMALPGAAFAQNGILGKHDADKPVNISGDHFEADTKGKTYTYTGNVIGIQGDIRLRADKMKWDQTADKIYANGKVVVDSPTSGTVTGDNGIYDMTKKLVTLSGNVVVHKQGQATLQGSLMTVNMVTGLVDINGAPVAGTANQAAAAGTSNGRVSGVITPKSSTGTP